jgi:pyruvate/2-oxoglutarate dehydrogenase complex dihydrolipoamide acyltransferase (E2) component
MSDFTLPDLGEGIHEAEIISIKVKEGDRVEEDQPLFEVETDKAVVEIPSPYAGIVTKIHVKEGTVVKVGINMISFDVAGGAKPKEASEKKEHAAASSSTGSKSEAKTESHSDSKNLEKVPAAKATAPATADNARTTSGGNGRPAKPAHDPNRPVPAAPAVRRLARELGVDLYTVHGSGGAGRGIKQHFIAKTHGTHITIA